MKIAPATLVYHSFEVSVRTVADNSSIARYGSYEVVKLGFNGGQVRKYVCVIIFQVIQDRDLRPVMDKLGAFIEKSGVVLICFHHKVVRTLTG